jgi:MFS family permease
MRWLLGSDIFGREPNLFYGWRIAGVAFAAHFVASGLSFYALPRLLVPLADEFAGGDRGPVALLIPAMSLPGLIAGPIVGRAIAKNSLRTVMSLGALLLGLGFLAASQVQTLWQLLLVYALAVPFAVAGLSNIGANSLVSNWFDRRRPMAVGVAQFGLSVCGAVTPFFVGWTLASGGWRGTYLWFAGIALATAPLMWMLVKDRPQDLGLHPDGEEPEAASAPSAGRSAASGAAAILSFGEAVRDSRLWLVGCAAGLAFSGTTALLQNMHAISTDAGYSAEQADWILAIMAVGAAVGKLVFGALGVRFGERTAFMIAVAGEGVGLALLPSATDSFTFLASLALGFGLAVGGVMPAMAALLARLFGAEHFAVVMGYVSPILIPFQMIGAPLAAWVYDRDGSYDPAIYGFVAACGLAVVALLALRDRAPLQDAAAVNHGR